MRMTTSCRCELTIIESFDAGIVNLFGLVMCANERMLLKIADGIGNTLYKKRDGLFLHKHYNTAYPALSLLEDYFAETEGE